VLHRADDGNTVRPSHIESSTRKISEEFAAMGINLKQALKNKVFMFNEFGLGGTGNCRLLSSLMAPVILQYAVRTSCRLQLWG
jgi:hypothetical protein